MKPNTKANAAPVSGQHTPGPWRTLANAYIGQWQVHSDKVRICTVSTLTDHWGSKELVPQADLKAAANARLIAAAPQLLEALRAMVAIHGPVATVSESVKALNQARAAIARAEGRES